MKKLITIRNPKSPISEAYRGIRTSIEFSNIDKDLKTIVVTSTRQNEGKSTVIANLAVTFASLDKKVLIIDGDLRNPSVHKMFGVSNIHGITDILVNNRAFVDCAHTTGISNLHVLTVGPMPPNPSEILSSKKMKQFIEGLKDNYDYIFIDAPPIGIVTDAGIISTYADGCIFVVGANEADIDHIKIAKERLDSIGANILGTILNKMELKGSDSYYYNYYYQQEHESKGGRKRLIRK